MLAYTGFPGYYGVDEEESELTLGFWYLFQETLWSTDFYVSGEEKSDASERNGPDQVIMARAVYFEVVKLLRRKATFPIPGSNWSKGNFALIVERYFRLPRDRSSGKIPSVSMQRPIRRSDVDYHHSYRRDIGDTLINA